ncbi:MAG: DUF962 domain-containing protein [Deltaproteobacteria bacterium]|nr:MAG: DUF962 domain-containing protein [Deltaproteobacteria bacterium]
MNEISNQNKSFLDVYREKHQHPMNRLLHTFGIPMIVISLIVVFLNWKLGVGLFVFGWMLQFVGHIFEGKWPAFFSNPAYLFVGMQWWVKKLFKKT